MRCEIEINSKICLLTLPCEFVAVGLRSTNVGTVHTFFLTLRYIVRTTKASSTRVCTNSRKMRDSIKNYGLTYTLITNKYIFIHFLIDSTFDHDRMEMNHSQTP